ncbi:MAG: starch synthase [Sphingobacteriales bacterium BACL12 MAG-120813-bin55]|jgi:starch synthase|nr:MAG: starch synthase [Sphingobacteriales bacterium BACL12 MAG-120813-bin55]
MENKRVLVITQEMSPYLNGTEMSAVANELPQYFQNQGDELRILMPRYGTINERRHRLHEVVRLSGMNIIIDNDDYPLIIKVASLPGSRLQVYFLDNEDLFKRKYIFHDENEKFFEDNAERMVFFCKAVLETVKKFQWAPDIIHCHGWMTSLIPLYIKTAYKNEPVFNNAKVVFSVYKSAFAGQLSNSFMDKAPISELVTGEHLKSFSGLDVDALYKGGAEYADAVIVGSDGLDKATVKHIKDLKKPTLEYAGKEEGYEEKYSTFYNSL